MTTSIVLTVIAEDQPGVIQIVSHVLHRHGGSWSQSSMSCLAGYFAGILMASVPSDKTDACLEELRGLESQGLQVIANISQGESPPKDTQVYDLDLVGNDRPGIIHDITGILANYGVNVHNLETKVEAASMSGGELFKATAQLTIPRGTDIDSLEVELEEMANDLMVDITFEK